MVSIQSLDLLLSHAHMCFINVIINISCKKFTKSTCKVNIKCYTDVLATGISHY